MKKRWAAVCIISILGCVFSGMYAYRYQQNIKKGQEEAQELRDLVKKKTDASEQTEALPAEPKNQKTELEAVGDFFGFYEVKGETLTEDAPEEPVEIPIDFEALQEINEDAYAWITVPGTNVDYPILQDPEDNTFYLEHSLTKEYLFAGCIYSEKENAKDFKDFNTVLYGHNMKDGSMFASLHKFRDRQFFDEHREILVYTPERIYHYEIFAAYKFDNRHLLNSWDFKQEAVEDEKEREEKQLQEKRAYLKEVYGVRAMDAYFLDEPKVGPEDRILTLSTCINDKNYRYLIQGVLVKTEPEEPEEPEVPEEMTEPELTERPDDAEEAEMSVETENE